MYVARPDDSREVHAQAWRFRLEQYLKDWLPPITYRGWERVLRVMNRLF